MILTDLHGLQILKFKYWFLDVDCLWEVETSDRKVMVYSVSLSFFAHTSIKFSYMNNTEVLENYQKEYLFIKTLDARAVKQWENNILFAFLKEKVNIQK